MKLSSEMKAHRRAILRRSSARQAETQIQLSPLAKRIDAKAQQEGEAMDLMADYTGHPVPMQGYVLVGLMREAAEFLGAMRRAYDESHNATTARDCAAHRATSYRRQEKTNNRPPVTRADKQHTADTADLREVLAMARQLDLMAAQCTDAGILAAINVQRASLAKFRAIA